MKFFLKKFKAQNLIILIFNVFSQIFFLIIDIINNNNNK